MEDNNRRTKVLRVARLLLYFLFIVYITVLSRIPTLTRSVHLTPFWSFASQSHRIQLILNIALFIPLGYLLRGIMKNTPAILFGLLTTVSIEFAQFLCFRGMFDADDIISNLLGVVIGCLIWRAVERKGWNRRTEIVMLAAGLVGCLIVGIPNTNNNTIVTDHFNFKISNFAVNAGSFLLSGEVEVYERSTPNYTLLLNGIPISTTVNGDDFIATAAVPADKTELQIRFKGYNVMPTGVWLNPVEDGVRIEYVAVKVTEPEGVPEDAVLKAYSPDFETFVYQRGRKLLWFIGWDELDSETEIIYHLRTNTPELLPENRVKSGFDNRGFRAKKDEAGAKEIEEIGHYRVFEDIIPDDYNVTAVIVGFNTEGSITWRDSFRIDRPDS